MLTFYTTPVISILFALSGIISSGARPTNSTSSAPTNAPTTEENSMIQEYFHLPDSCALSFQDEVDTLNIACLLEDIGPPMKYQEGSGCTHVSSDNSIPGLYRALTEILSEFERTDLAVQNFNESVRTLKRFVIPVLNRAVNEYCNCSNSTDCTALNVSSVFDDVSSANNDNPDGECLLSNLRGILNHKKLSGRCRVCRRAQWKLMTDFQTAIERYYNVITSSVSIRHADLPRLCLYGLRRENLTYHVRALYTIAPYLSSLNATEPQHLSKNISEIIFPVINELMGEDYVETATNSSTPFSSSEEASLEALSEEQRTVCLIQRLKQIFNFNDRNLMQALRDEIRDPCV